MNRPPTNGTTSSSGSGLQTTQSLLSFPSRSRSPSQISRTSDPPKSSLPPMDSQRSSDQRPHTPSRHSGQSSLAGSHKYAAAHPQRRLRSQYPRDDPENHVEYILVASFDIDRGPIMEHQFPVAITGDEHMLAELMLPDQAHIRNQDWTIFFLHKDTSREEDEDDDEGSNGRSSDGEHSEGSVRESEPEGGEGPPLTYVLNLVNTKQDKTAKRGAVVKAMAICTRHPFLHIYKPLLLLALEEYFKSPETSTLALLYEAVNSMDLSLMPRLTLLERTLLQISDNKDLFVEKFEQMIQMRIEEDRETADPVSAGPTSPERRPDLTRTGTKAHIEAASAAHGYALPRDTHEFESKVMYNGISIPIKVPVAISPETVGDFSIIKLIQTFSEPHLKSPQPFTLHPHLTTSGPFTHPIIVLVNALLTQKRIIFLGHNRPSGEVAEAVLAACALASGGVLRGFTRHAFPYTDLTKIDDLLKVPGFIAGVTNLIFENHPEWWDVLCDLPSGRITISSRIDAAPVTEGFTYFLQQNPNFASLVPASSSNNAAGNDVLGDHAFMTDIMRSIHARHGEGVVRAKWRAWITKFCRIAAAFEESVYGASAIHIGGEDSKTSRGGMSGHGYVWSDDAQKQKELAGSVNRIEGWRNTRSYYSFIQDIAQLYSLRPVKSLDLSHLHDRLRMQKLSPQVSRDIYLAFADSINTYDEICQLLTVAPESQAGLFYIALGLFHKDREVRLRVVDLLERISVHDAGRHWWTSLSHFQKLAWIRIRRELETESRSRSEFETASDKARSLSNGLARR